MLLCTQSVDINMSRIETCQSGSSAQYINCMAIKVPLNRTMITQYIETPCLEIWWHRTRWKRSNCWHILGDFHTYLPFRVNTIELTNAIYFAYRNLLSVSSFRYFVYRHLFMPTPDTWVYSVSIRCARQLPLCVFFSLRLLNRLHYFLSVILASIHLIELNNA